MTTPRRAWPKPAAGVISRDLGEETILLDSATNTAASLEGPPAQVWRAIRDGSAPTATDAELDQAIAELTDLGYLQKPASGITRRTLTRGGIVAGVGIATLALAEQAAFASALRTLVLTPSSGPDGTVVHVSGTGYAPNSTIQITFDGVSQPVSGSTTTDSTGAILSTTTFTVPNGATVGGHTVAAVVAGQSTSSPPTFTVTAPTITASPATLTKNGSPQNVTFTGSGFAPNSTITATVGGKITSATHAGAVTTTSTGALPSGLVYSVAFPPGEGNNNGTVTLTDAAGNSATFTFV